MTDSNNKISIILPCYNVSKYLDRCMTSIVDQTLGFDNLEIILVDDCSTDDTWEKINEWEQKYSENIIAVHLDVNSRQGKARNVGLSYASGNWIGFVDSDDWIEPTYFEKLLAAAKENDADIAYCRLGRDKSQELSYFEDTSLEEKSRLLVMDTDEKQKMFAFGASISFPPHSKLFKKSFLIDNELFFPENLAYEDCCWGSLIYYYAKRVYILEEKLYHYFVNDTSTVMVKNADYHVDMLTVHIKLWDEYLARGLYPKYKDEIEYNFLYTCYLGFIKVLALRYAEPSFSQFKLLKQIVLERIPDWKDNIYIKNKDIIPLHLEIIKLLDTDVDKGSFFKLMDAVKASGM